MGCNLFSKNLLNLPSFAIGVINSAKYFTDKIFLRTNKNFNHALFNIVHNASETFIFLFPVYCLVLKLNFNFATSACWALLRVVVIIIITGPVYYCFPGKRIVLPVIDARHPSEKKSPYHLTGQDEPSSGTTSLAGQHELELAVCLGKDGRELTRKEMWKKNKWKKVARCTGLSRGMETPTSIPGEIHATTI